MENSMEIKSFEYNLLDKHTAEFLKIKELNMKSIASTMINQLGRELKEAQDELAGNNQYNGVFEKWYTSLGFKKTTVYNYINKYKYIASSTVEQAEIIEELPAGLVYEITKPSANKEINEKVFNGDITSLKEYRKIEKEKKELEEQLEETQYKYNEVVSKNTKLLEKEPKVIEVEVPVEKIPDDYNYYKESTRQFYRLQEEVEVLKKELNNRESSKEDFNRLRTEYEEKVNESHELKKQIEQLVHVDSSVRQKEKLKDSALIFSTRIHTFLNDVGGLAWLTEYIDELDDYDKRSYIKAIDLLEGWVLTVKSNINKEEL